jgi:predicted transposase YdaD
LSKVLSRGLNGGLNGGIEQGEKSLVLRQLARQVGDLPVTVRAQVEQLPLSQLEALGEALLDFNSLNQLQTWLSQEHNPL